MSVFFELKEERTSRYSGALDAVHRWGLPGVRCSECGQTWAASVLYPGVDLSGLPERASFEDPWPRPVEEFERLRELVRPLAPKGAWLPPGTRLGPLSGTASGSFGAFHYYHPWTLLGRREALEALTAAGIRGLRGQRTGLRFRQKKAPELLELQLEQQGQLHPECLPLAQLVPCERCGRGLRGSYTLPDNPVLDAASLPEDLDLFRLADTGLLVASLRLVEAARRLGLDGVTFQELSSH